VSFASELFAINPNEISETRVLLALLGGRLIQEIWNDLGD